MKKVLPTPATSLPEITATFERPEHLYIQFAEPLDSTQTNLIREICLKLQNFPGGFIFSYAIISGNLLEERLPKNPLRQSDAGGNVIHITRGRRRGEKPSIETIRTSVLLRLNKYIQKIPAS
ncbi:MAG: hypothetical protein QG581_403 [Patescibacteria group bacterium]|jgi:hypothetical protein|nr:hypothetical protein [Patescibacteria group bacterium]